jgi:cyanate lyase
LFINICVIDGSAGRIFFYFFPIYRHPIQVVLYNKLLLHLHDEVFGDFVIFEIKMPPVLQKEEAPQRKGRSQIIFGGDERTQRVEGG